MFLLYFYCKVRALGRNNIFESSFRFATKIILSMTKSKVCSHSALEIFIACLIPNLGAIIIFIILGDRIEENEERERVKSFLDLPRWVNARRFEFSLSNGNVTFIRRSFQLLGRPYLQWWGLLVGACGALARSERRFPYSYMWLSFC